MVKKEEVKDKKYEKDYCSFFPENFGGKYIGGCCKVHDNEVGERGSYNPLVAMEALYLCLTAKRLSFKRKGLVVIAGTIGALIRYPYFAVTKYLWRRNNKYVPLKHPFKRKFNTRPKS